MSKIDSSELFYPVHDGVMMGQKYPDPLCVGET